MTSASADADAAGRERGAGRVLHHDFGFGEAELVDRRVGVAVAAHRGVAERQHAAGFGAGEASAADGRARPGTAAARG